MHMFHPIIVHFTIALLSVGIITDFLYLISRKENHRQTAGYLLILGSISAVLAVLTGNAAADVVTISAEARPLVENHRSSGTLTMWLFLLVGAIRIILVRQRQFNRSLKWIYYCFGLVALLSLFRTGLLGGNMVYFHGVGMERPLAPPAEKPSFEE